MAFYATCPHCKLPNLVEESAREISMRCSACGKMFRPLRQTARPTWTSPPTRPDPPLPLGTEAKGWGPDIWANDYLRMPDQPVILSGQQAGRTAQGLLTLVALVEFFHALVACLMWTTVFDDGFHGPRGSEWGLAGGGCLCGLSVFYLLFCIYFLIWLGNAYTNLPMLGATGLRFHPALVVLGFLIPVVNLFLPYLCMQELWRASTPNDSEGHWSDAASSKQITAWWTCWVLALFSYVAIVALPVASEFMWHGAWLHRPAVVIFYGMINVLGPVCAVAANVLLIGVIEDIILRQCKKYLAHKELGLEWGRQHMDNFSE